MRNLESQLEMHRLEQDALQEAVANAHKRILGLRDQRQRCAEQKVHVDGASTPVLPFFKIKYIFFGYFDPENTFLGNENQYFLG